MRWITGRHQRPRRNSPLNDDESGAVTVLTAVLMVALLLMVAMVVDTGLAYSEKAQLQNAADSAALAAANCSAGTPACTQSQAQALAAGLVNQNSNDGSSNLNPLDFTVAGQVTATTTTLSNGNSFLTLPFAGITGVSEGRVAATATATLGSVSEGTAVLPFTLGACQVDLGAPDSLIYLHTATNAKKCDAWNPASGLNGPGGFGFLAPNTDCTLVVSIYGVAPSDAGNSMPFGNSGCRGVLEANLGKTVLLPIFSAYDSGSKTYTIAGWAAFVLTGWNLPSAKPHNSYNWSGSNGDTGLRGHFIKVLSFKEGFEYNAPPSKFGDSFVHLIK